MVRRKDPLWDHVDELDNQRFRCKFCGRNFAGGIPRIKSHLSCITGRGIDICAGVPDDVRDYAISEIGQPSKKARTATTSVDIWANGSSPSSTKHLSGIVQQNSMPAMHGNDRIVADENLARFLLHNNVSYDVLKKAPYFSEFTRSVAECGRDYELPSPSKLETTIFPDILTEVKTHVRNVKESWMDSGCTVLVEVWHNSITIIAYSVKGAVFIKSFDSISEKSDSDIKDTVSSVIEDIGYDNVVQLITNDDRVFRSVRDMLGDLYPRIYMTRCVAHEIHLLLKSIYDIVCWVKLVIEQAALVVKYMYGDANILSLMRKFTSGRELKHLCMSKFSSSYIMLQSIFDNETELRQLVASEEWSFLHENNERDKVTEIIQSGEFWTQGQDVQKVMKPFFQVLCLVEDERSTSTYFYEVMERAKVAIEGLCNNDQMKYKEILEIFEERRSHIIQPIHAAAAFLNPAYMCHGNFKANREMKAGVDFILRTMVTDDEEKKNLSNQFHLYRAKAPELFTKEAYEMLEMHHPGLWWDYRGDCFPVLQKYATQILRQPCKCSLHLKYSAFVVPENVKMSTTTRDAWEKDECMKINAIMMEKFRSLYKRNLEPIELQNCSELPDYVNYDNGCGDDADNCDDCNKTNGSSQMVVINARSADHTTNQLDVFCKANERAWKDLLSDNIARLKDGIPEGLFPDTSEIHDDYQFLLHRTKDGRSSVDYTDKASGLPSRKENDEAEVLGDEPGQQLASTLNSQRAVISSSTFSYLSPFIRDDIYAIWSTGQDKAHNSNECEPAAFGDTDSIHNAPVDPLGVNWKGSAIAFSDGSGWMLRENYNWKGKHRVKWCKLRAVLIWKSVRRDVANRKRWQAFYVD